MKFKFFSRKNATYTIFPLVPLFDNKYNNFKDDTNDMDAMKLNKLYKEFQKCNNEDLDKLELYEKIVEVLININVRFLNADTKPIYLHMLLVSTDYCSNNKDLKLNDLISKLIKIYLTDGRYIISNFPQISATKQLIIRLKCYENWNFQNETILDSLIKFLLTIKCKLSSGRLDLFENVLLVEMNRQRLYNLYISCFYNDIYEVKNKFKINFISKWIENLYYLIVINAIYIYNFIKLLQTTYTGVTNDVNNIENDTLSRNTSKNKRDIVISIRENLSDTNDKIENITNVEYGQKQLVDIQYFRQRKPRRTHSEWSYSGNSTTFQLDRSRYSPTHSEFTKQLPRHIMEPRWPE